MAGRIMSPEVISRDDELATIDRAFELAREGRGRTVLIGGEAGIGKSRVLSEALKRARKAGALVLVGGCIGLAEGALPFGPIVEAIRPLLREGTGGGPTPPQLAPAAPVGSETAPAQTGVRDAIGGSLLDVAAELGLLARQRPGAAASAEMRPEWARSQLYEAFLDLLRRLAADRPVVLAVEDLHWADESTRELLAFLVRNARSERLLLLVTFRSDELHRRHPLLQWLVEVDRGSNVERIELGRLGRDSVARQLAAILGRRAETTLVDSVFARSEGNPFFAEELLAAGAESGRLPPTLREVLAARLAHVSEQTIRVLGIAAVVGRRVEHDLLARIADFSEDELDDALQEALAAQILVADEDAIAARYAFRHALLGEAAAETVLPSRRRRLHAAIAAALGDANGFRGAEEAGHLAEIAHHWFEARELDRAFEASVLAGNAATDASAYAEALRQYERAVELWDVVGDPVRAAGFDRIELLRRAAHAAQVGGEYARAIQLLQEGIVLAEERGDSIRAGLLSERLGRSLWTSGELERGQHAYRRATELVPEQPPSEDRARVLAGLAQVLMLSGHHAESLSIGEHALELARAAESRQLEGHVLCTIGVDVGYVGDADAAVAMVREAISIAEEVQDFDDIGRGYANLASVLDVAGRAEEAVAVALEGGRRLRELGMGLTYGTFVEANASDDLTTLGRWDEALELMTRVAESARGTSRIFANQQLAHVQMRRGEFDRARLALEESSRTLDGSIEAQFSGPLAFAEIELSILTSDLDAGRRVVDRILPIISQTEDLPIRAGVLVAAIRLEATIGERARAARDELAVAEARHRATACLDGLHALAPLVPSPQLRAAVDRGIAIGEAEASRFGEPDIALWRRAAERAHARGPVYDTAYCEYRLGEALLASRGSREEAAALLGGAHRTALRLGARPLQESIEALATRARLPLAEAAPGAPAGVTTAASTAGLARYGLSPREIEVLALLAAGRTNRQIGEALFISESTAGVHVSHILNKLGVTGRVEAATVAVRLGVAREAPQA